MAAGFRGRRQVSSAPRRTQQVFSAAATTTLFQVFFPGRSSFGTTGFDNKKFPDFEFEFGRLDVIFVQHGRPVAFPIRVSSPCPCVRLESRGDFIIFLDDGTFLLAFQQFQEFCAGLNQVSFSITVFFIHKTTRRMIVRPRQRTACRKGGGRCGSCQGTNFSFHGMIQHQY
jgi:hypothetical protein